LLKDVKTILFEITEPQNINIFFVFLIFSFIPFLGSVIDIIIFTSFETYKKVAPLITAHGKSPPAIASNIP